MTSMSDTGTVRGVSAGPPVPDPDARYAEPESVSGAQAHNGHAPGASTSWKFLPGLEGLRGLAVLAVLVFHGGFALARGGFLGVSTFFTLSGFLITSLLLREHEQRGGIGLGQFWRRRFRRLIPASVATVLIACVYVTVAGDPSQKHKFGGDAVAALFNAANWRFLLSGQSYGDLFTQPSPLLHFWSLAIEEQFYLVFPLLCFGVLVSLGWSRRRFGAVLGVLLAGSVSLSLFGHLSTDAMYYGTGTRAAELLVGALLAVIITDKRLRVLTTAETPAMSLIAGMGAASLLATVLWWSAVPQSSPWVYQGGLLFYSLLSVSLILAAILSFGPVRTLLGSWPLRQLGLISYGVYVYHWPVFLWLSPASTGSSTVLLFVPRIALTLVVAALSFRYLEQPIRAGARPLRLPPVTIWLGSAVAAGAAALVIATTAPPLTYNFAADQKRLAAGVLGGSHGGTNTARATGGGQQVASAGSVSADLPAPVVPKSTIFGDSTALATAFGLNQVFSERGLTDQVPGDAQLGCSLARTPESIRGGVVGKRTANCNWTARWAGLVQRYQPQLAIVQFGPWEIEPQRLPGGDPTWRFPGDPVFDAFELHEMLDAVDTLSSTGAVVVWLTAPSVGIQAKSTGQASLADLLHPERMAAFNRLLSQLPGLRPGKVAIVDLAGAMASSINDPRVRPDGVHLTQASAYQVSQTFLASAIMDAFQKTLDGRRP